MKPCTDEIEIHDEFYCYRGVIRLADGRKFSAVAPYNEYSGRELAYRRLEAWLKARADKR